MFILNLSETVMNSTQFYFIIIENITVILIFYHLILSISAFLYLHYNHFFLAHLIYSHMYCCIFCDWLVFRYHVFLQILYFESTATCNFLDMQIMFQTSFCAACLTLINLASLLFADCHNFKTQLLKLSLRAYKSTHSIIVFMILIQNLFHLVLIAHIDELSHTQDF